MKTAAYIAMVIAGISFISGLISRLTMTPIAVGYGGALTAQSFLALTNTCLLIAIALILLEILKSK